MLGRGADAKMNLSTFETHLKLSVPSQQTMRLTSSVKIKTPGNNFQDTPAHIFHAYQEYNMVQYGQI